MIPIYSQPEYSYPVNLWPLPSSGGSTYQILQFKSEIRNLIKIGENMRLIDYFYDGQNAVQMRAYNLGDLTTASTCLIKYKKPDLTTGQWTATIDTENDGEIYYDLLNTEFLTAGNWTFWTHITYTDGRIGIGDPKTITIREEGQ